MISLPSSGAKKHQNLGSRFSLVKGEELSRKRRRAPRSASHNRERDLCSRRSSEHHGGKQSDRQAQI